MFVEFAEFEINYTLKHPSRALQLRAAIPECQAQWRCCHTTHSTGIRQNSTATVKLCSSKEYTFIYCCCYSAQLGIIGVSGEADQRA